MINLLPPDIKQQMRFGRYNVRAVTYLWLILGTVIVLGAAFTGTLYYLSNQSRQLDLTEAAQQTEIDSYGGFVKDAHAASDRLAAIKGVLGTQTRFSLLLSDLAKVVPNGVSLDSITLTGDDKKPIRLTISATSYETALAFRDAVISSPRIAAADVENVSKQDKTGIGAYTASITVAFKPGQAK